MRILYDGHIFRIQPAVAAEISDAPERFDGIVRAMQMDKEFRDRKNVFVLSTAIGARRRVENTDSALILEAVQSSLARAQ